MKGDVRLIKVMEHKCLNLTGFHWLTTQKFQRRKNLFISNVRFVYYVNHINLIEQFLHDQTKFQCIIFYLNVFSCISKYAISNSTNLKLLKSISLKPFQCSDFLLLKISFERRWIIFDLGLISHSRIFNWVPIRCVYIEMLKDASISREIRYW